MFLHDMGYTLFNINALTMAETNLLISVFNDREKEKEREYKKHKK